MTSFWSAWIIVLTTVTLILVTWVLFANRKTNVRDEQNPTTGHVYDGIEEYDNPLPGWWFKMFVLTIIFAVGYLIAYPGMGNFKGVLGWSSTGQWEKEVGQADAKTAELYASFMATPVEDLASQPKAMRIGRRVFANNCAICHGAEAKGAYGFPNLSDHDWLYGGTPDAIKASITEGRMGSMPPWEAVLGEAGLTEMTHYVMSLSEPDSATKHSETSFPEAKYADAVEKYSMLCAGCHMADGSGNPILGAPRLNDNIWLYGGDAGRIKQTIASGRSGKMPAHAELLSAEKIHLLTAYVYSLSNSASNDGQ